MTAWTDHIKSVAKKEGLSYKEAMKVASKTFTKGGSKVDAKKETPKKMMPKKVKEPKAK